MMPNTMQAERLNFVLPDFLRLAWVNDHAREIWAERFQRVMRAWAELEWLSVGANIRDCALVRVSRQDYEIFVQKLATHGLDAGPLDEGEARKDPSLPVNGAPADRTWRVVVGPRERVPRFQEILNSGDHVKIGSLLGYPNCCTKAFEQRCSDNAFFDPTWLMALEIASILPTAALIEVEQGPLTNMLLRWAGIRAIPHLPCSFGCGASIQFGKCFLQLGMESGFQTEMEWLEHILSWPMEWSGLHGIAEIRTPVLKVSTNTEATAQKRVVRWKGSQYPEGGAQGLGFPYRMPPRPLTTGSPSFQRALEQAAGVVRIQPLEKQTD